MNYKLVKVATNWWMEQIQKRCYKLYPHKITRNNSEFLIIDHSLAEELSIFKCTLSNVLKEKLENHSYISLTCFHIPNRELADIAKKAELPTSYFPRCAEMQICHNSIIVSLKDENIYEKPLAID